MKTSVLLPRGMAVVAPGVERSPKATSEGVWHTFETMRPAVNFSVVADRRWIRTERRAGAVRMVTLLHPDVQRFAATILRGSADVIAYYARVHGYYPADQFAFVTLTGMYARRAFSGFIGYSPQYLEQTMVRDGYDGHETALLWWGYATHGEGPGAFQWTEGFGDYVEILYTQTHRKPLPWNVTRARDAFRALDPAADVALADLKGATPQAIVHGKLPWRAALIDLFPLPDFRHQPYS